MQFKDRLNAVRRVLEAACYEGHDILIFGKGQYLKLVEKLVFSLSELYFPGHALMLQEEPTVKVFFQGGGQVVVVDADKRRQRGMRYLESAGGFDTILIVEDKRGELIVETRDLIVPLMARKHNTMLSILGESLD